ncbi:MAG: hypothetical protein KC415_21755 [Anaerolineales bacterium]|nr:hypothetical protein [Anaerolineales bacterium]MCB8991088.1 hypothetical protein [Ardenticatenaceae bacterium]MCB9004130.1 hypothetical protein [Ardenticatenaceae bacterium]
MKTKFQLLFTCMLPIVGLVWLSQLSQAATTATNIMPVDANVLALFPFDGDTTDISGNARHATLISGTFTTTVHSQGLALTGGLGVEQGFQWNNYAHFLVPPYTIEMILTPTQTDEYAKLFGSDDTNDSGWYYFTEGLRSYPNDSLGVGMVLPNRSHYIAFVSQSITTTAVYFQGQYLGIANTDWMTSTLDAIFFNDDSDTTRYEQFAGIVEEVRISDVSRTAGEIAAVQAILTPEHIYLPMIVQP